MIHRGKTIPTLDDLRAMNARLAHRGPDNEDVWLHENVGLAHRRLSIIDLSAAARQPMTSPGLASRIIFNGELYNYQDVRSELVALGHPFATRSDTEVILRAYAEWGPDCLPRFNGMFAFAIYDERTRTLFLARDRMGVKPLYYYEDGERLIFGSELKALLVCPGFRKEPDMRSVEHYFAFKYVRAPHTIFKNTYKLLPGHSLTIKDGTLSLQQYWDLPQFVEAQKSPADERQYLDELEGLLEDAVRSRLISDVPLGALLSGGIDSSLVVAAMTKLGSGVRTFTIGFPDEELDEAPHARAVAQALGTTHTELYVTPHDVFDTIEVLADHFDEPFADPSAIPTLLLSRLTRQHVTVALSGDGGDELFWGYARYRKYAYARRLASLPTALRQLASKMLTAIPHDVIQKVGQGIGCTTLDGCYDYLNGMFKGRHLDQLFAYPLSLRPTQYTGEFRLPPVSSLLRPNAVDFHAYLPDDVLAKVDRTSMSVALEVRSPFLDYRLVEFALRLPFDLKFRDGSQKYILKKLLARRLPADLFLRPKAGFDLPLNRWFRHELKDLLLARLERSRLERYGFLNASFVQEIVQKHLSGHYDYYYMLWTLLAFDSWYDRYYQ